MALMDVEYIFNSVVGTGRSSSGDSSDGPWRELELNGTKQPVQTDVDNNSDADLPPADKSTHH